MGDLSKNVIDLAISTIKKTHHGVTIATVPEQMKAALEVRCKYVSSIQIGGILRVCIE